MCWQATLVPAALWSGPRLLSPARYVGTVVELAQVVPQTRVVGNLATAERPGKFSCEFRHRLQMIHQLVIVAGLILRMRVEFRMCGLHQVHSPG